MQKPQHDLEPLGRLSMEGVASRAFWESVQMRLYDRLDTPRTAAQIAAEFSIEAHGAEAFLDVLESRAILVKDGETYVNSPVASEYLVSSSPFYQGACLTLHQKPSEYVMREMSSLLRTEAPNGSNLRREVTPEVLAGIAQYSLRAGLQDTVEFIASLPGFLHLRTMCDVGGSHGRYAMGLLDRHPDLHAVLADLPNVVPAATAVCQEAGYGERLSVLSCDLRSDRLPRQAYDLVLASHVLYPFSDSLEAIVAKIADSLKPGGWFVSHHLNPDNEVCRRFWTAVSLTTCLTANLRHVLSSSQLEAALRGAGLDNLHTATAGYHSENQLMAAQRRG